MKLIKSKIAQAIGAVLTATVASQAFAIDASTYVEDANQVTLNISGATATRPGLLKLFQLNNANNGICADNTLDLYQSLDGLNYLMMCTGRTGGSPALPASLQGKRIAVLKSDAGGSGNGVGPLTKGILHVPFWDLRNLGPGFLAGCAGVTTAPVSSSFSAYVLHTGCTNGSTNATGIAPDAGISDLEPAIFKAVFTPALTNGDLAAIPGNPISAVIFGIPVSLNVRDNMQRILFQPNTNVCNPDNPVAATYLANAETAACQPSLTKSQLAALYTQNYPDWTFLSTATGSVASPDAVPAHQLGSSAEVFICRRTATSGTQAVFETQLLNQRCVAGVPTFVTAAFDATHVNEASGSGGVVSCLKANNTAGLGAIGVLSMEFPTTNTHVAATDSGYRYVKINDMSPCLLPTVQSKYDFLGESTMQWRVIATTAGAALSANPSALALATAVRDRIGAPAVVNDLNTAFTHSFCATQGSGALLGNALTNGASAAVPPFTAGDGTANDVVLHPVLPKTRGINGPNSCGALIDIVPTTQLN